MKMYICYTRETSWKWMQEYFTIKKKIYGPYLLMHKLGVSGMLMWMTVISVQQLMIKETKSARYSAFQDQYSNPPLKFICWGFKYVNERQTRSF